MRPTGVRAACSASTPYIGDLLRPNGAVPAFSIALTTEAPPWPHNILSKPTHAVIFNTNEDGH